MEIRDFRALSRHLVRELGMLNKQSNGSRFSPLQIHLMIELKQQPLAVMELAMRLCIDKASASRALNSLVKAQMIEIVEHPQDRRQTLHRLTREGKKTLMAIDTDADDFMLAALAQLDDDEIAATVATIKKFASALGSARRQRAAELRVRPITAQDDAAMAAVIRATFREYGMDKMEGVSVQDPHLDQLTAVYQRNGGHYWVVERHGEVAGGVGIAPLVGGEPDYCELQKLFFKPEIRGLGMARYMVVQAMQAARAAGYRYCYLETTEQLKEAVGLYRSLGFSLLNERRGNTGHHGCAIFMLKELTTLA
ncbi:bifunctional helix-turn-helix transcriptional regulator/GNAT family N-acetyltransferase [Serratia sp. AKBS12]|uniref:bifunctional helix-turn-helix transcriptional regulator/GNAT family N-acetyltransferase n=1 Tax=Serratia sp. AKBS12 TaxID=2974597 RepID=UPI0021657B26|nr:bifunctional helix-turn-helix transcriptional regulator/GNAT family N-acetyltransferase [Serratia sp. AKBS12]MCS3409530.1 bifunctional helix-turn-helix transcriptional regulator/GNAT family N-acetyltransferase [Serratia sp. AKBS12]